MLIIRREVFLMVFESGQLCSEMNRDGSRKTWIGVAILRIGSVGEAVKF